MSNTSEEQSKQIKIDIHQKYREAQREANRQRARRRLSEIARRGKR